MLKEEGYRIVYGEDGDNWVIIRSMVKGAKRPYTILHWNKEFRDYECMAFAAKYETAVNAMINLSSHMMDQEIRRKYGKAAY